MKKYFYSIFILVFVGTLIYSLSEANAKKEITRTEKKSFYDLKIRSIDGVNTIQMKDFKGKFVLCVNVASECGYTPQYESLQKLSEEYKDKLIIIGFPCNQFLGQEPGTSEEIVSFCKKNYGITFQLTEKIDVKGKNQNEIYQWLTQKNLNGISDAEIKWNFNKILIDPNGNWVSYFPSKVIPLSEELTNYLK
ncbi:MAG: glutathione peroxidase [Bacteroidia bacterium]|nr:glutathione peroxidase [Bacteroidia bacterium]MCF8426272.1 glutathione peroxidase [Bacteroidia bacterium]MCF8445477.1 glutathione peroxidase [Bacteroidia bacterium]